MPVSRVTETLASTTEPAFAVRLSGEIVAWNHSAERLLGYRADEVVGRACYAMLEGRDAFGNAYCVESCPVRTMIHLHRPISRFEIVYRSAAGADVPVAVSALVMPTAKGEEPVLIHLLRRRSLRDLVEESDPPETRAAYEDLVHRLTPRQIAVLRLLAQGATTGEIAADLCISELTVRNHIENLLRALHVHSRLEAVVVAHQSGLA